MQAAAPLDDLTTDSAFVRLWRGFMIARVTIAAVLVLLLGVLHSLAPVLNVSRWLVILCATYLVAALAARIHGRPLPPGRTFDPQWVYSIGVDLLAFSTLQFLQAAGINYSPLFALPVLMAAVLGSRLLALGTSAGVTLLLLIEAWLTWLHAAVDAGPFVQAGLTGSGYFVLAVLVNQLAARLAREERAAQHGQHAARAQAQVNALVIEALDEGVLVVDASLRAQAANPAARTLLGAAAATDGPLALDGHAAWQPLLRLAQRTFAQRMPQFADLALLAPRASARRVRVRTQLTSADPGDGAGLCVMFLQDLREMEARLRTEKLAAMGRMSAAVAHEIRNPLAAITQANDLLDEELREPAQRQLSALVRNNAQRLSQIVEEILDLSRAHPQGQGAPVLELDGQVAAICADWRTTQSPGCGRPQLALAAGGARVRFEPDHLRRILVNLLDNALRYASGQPDAIRVWTRSDAGVASLHVWSDGAPLEPTVQDHLFEPFFTSESRSSGLGLFICRELCERHGAAIAYERTPAVRPGNAREGNDFWVRFAPPVALAGIASPATIGA